MADVYAFFLSDPWHKGIKVVKNKLCTTQNLPSPSSSVQLFPLLPQVDATDEDSGPGGRVRYSCAGDCSNGFFEVSPLFGELLVARRLDAESDSLHRLQIVATDEGMSRLSSAVNVIVSGKVLFPLERALHQLS